MNVRVTQQTIFQQAHSGTRRLADQLALLQAQATTGKRFANISDDPATALTVLGNNIQGQRLSAYLDTIQTAKTALNNGVAALQEASTLFTQVRAIALGAASTVNNNTDFEAMAREVDAIIDRFLRLTNTQIDGTYLFAGTASHTEPFAVTRSDPLGRPVEIQYQAAGDATHALVDRLHQMAIFYPGDDVFMGRDRQSTVFTGATGAKAGLGTDTATGLGVLTLAHTSTTYAAGSGVQPGATSAAGDTILGVAGTHKLHITDTSGSGAAGWITLDDGAPVAFTGADSNLKLVNSKGDVVYVDTTAIAAGFDSDVDIAATGTLSIDGGATSIPITFAPDQMAQDSQTGKVTFVDTTGVTRIGTEPVAYPGTFDAFQSLLTLRDLLRNTGRLSNTDQIQAISNHVGEIDRARTRMLDVVGQQSASLSSLESLQAHLENMRLNAQTTASELGEADVTDLVVKLQAHEQMLQLALATFSRIVNLNLLDFLQ